MVGHLLPRCEVAQTEEGRRDAQSVPRSRAFTSLWLSISAASLICFFSLGPHSRLGSRSSGLRRLRSRSLGSRGLRLALRSFGFAGIGTGRFGPRLFLFQPHGLVIRALACATDPARRCDVEEAPRLEVGRPGADQPVVAQGIYQQVFCVDEADVAFAPRVLLIEIPLLKGGGLGGAFENGPAVLHRGQRAQHRAVGNLNVTIAGQRLFLGRRRWLLFQDEAQKVAIFRKRFVRATIKSLNSVTIITPPSN